jgi:hypothetical protein
MAPTAKETTPYAALARSLLRAHHRARAEFSKENHLETNESQTSVFGRCAPALVAGLLAGLILAPLGHADRTVTANEVCNMYKPGYIAMLSLGSVLPRAICVPPGTFLPGVTDSSEGFLAPTLPGLPPGSHRVNPWDPFSAWVIPG